MSLASHVAVDIVRTRLAIVTNYVPLYRFAVFSGLGRANNLQLRCFCTLSSKMPLSDVSNCFESVTTKGIVLHKGTFHRSVGVAHSEPFAVPVLLPFALLRFRPDIVVSGNMGPVSLVSMLTAKLLRVPFVVWTEDIAHTSASATWIQHRLRKVILRYSSAVLAWGKPALEHALSLGVERDRAYYCAQSIDNEWWIKQSTKTDRHEVRQQLKLKGRVFLVAGRLLPGKGIDKMLRAWSMLDRSLQENNTILIVGDGEAKSELKELVRAIDIPNVIFTGFKGYQELPAIYSAADVFVFPSLVDVWGMVVNEALACGLPILGSKYAGACQELLSRHDVGEMLDPLNISSLTDVFSRWLVRDLPSSDRLRDVVRQLDARVTINAFKKMIQKVTKDG